MAKWVERLDVVFERKTQIDTLAVPVQDGVKSFYKLLGSAGTVIADFLHGTWLGHPLHAVLVDIPVGSWTAAVALDVLESQTGSSDIGMAADAAVGIGTAAAVGSAISGLTDWQHLQGANRRQGFVHAALNSAALVLMVGSLVSRKTGKRSLGHALTLGGYLLSGVSAHLGGDLVYRQKVGVDHSPNNLIVKQYKPVLAESDLPEDKLTRAMLDETPIVLLRKGQRIYALAETCAHLGGPLSEGEIGEDDQGEPTVICPWHASEFDFSNGAIKKGPSAYAQPCFDVRIRAGQVEVRRNPK